MTCEVCGKEEKTDVTAANSVPRAGREIRTKVPEGSTDDLVLVFHVNKDLCEVCLDKLQAELYLFRENSDFFKTL
jgi:hypothetical protein